MLFYIFKSQLIYKYSDFSKKVNLFLFKKLQDKLQVNIE